MFESVSVKVRGTKPPFSGHLVLFFKVQIDRDSAEIELKIDPEEVDCVAWLTQQDLIKIFDYKDTPIKCYYPSK